MKLFKTNHTKKCFRRIMLENNISSLNLTTLRSMFQLLEKDVIYFKKNIHLIFRTYCYFDNVTKEQLEEIKTTVNSPSLKSQKLRYNLIEGTLRYHKSRIKNSKNRKLAVNKCRQTLLERYGDENYVNVKKCKETKLKRYGDENYNNQTMQEKTMIKKYGTKNISNSKHFYDIMVAKGKIVKKEDKSDYQMYKHEVLKISKSQNVTVLNNYDKRGRVDLKENAYHLDHMYSISEGFKNNIPPYIIGNICNLEFIPAVKNCAKQEECSHDKEELLIKYFKGKK